MKDGRYYLNQVNHVLFNISIWNGKGLVNFNVSKLEQIYYRRQFQQTTPQGASLII